MSRRPQTFFDAPLSDRLRNKHTLKAFLKPSSYGMTPSQIIARLKAKRAQMQGSGKRTVGNLISKVRRKAPPPVF